MNRHIWVCGDDLLFGGKLGALLEFEVTDGTGQGKVAVDTTEIDKATSSADTGLLALILGLVVERERLCAALDS